MFSRRYFEILSKTFSDCSDIVTVMDDERPIASVMNFYFRDEVLPYYGGGTAEARQRAGNDFMYWEVMRRAAGRGCRLFDFGRSKLGTGAFTFKHNWGFEPQTLHYRYRLAPRRGDTGPQSTQSEISAVHRGVEKAADARGQPDPGPALVRGLG